MAYNEDNIDKILKGYKMVNHMGETYYIDHTTNIAYMLCSFYKIEDEEPERLWRLEEVGIYNKEDSRIIFEEDSED